MRRSFSTSPKRLRLVPGAVLFQSRSGARPARSASPVALLLIMMLMLIPGCSGCRQSEELDADKQEEKDKEEEQELPDFVAAETHTLPYDKSATSNPVKPGHWTGLQTRWRANNFDASMNLVATASDIPGQPLSIEGSQNTLETIRPVSLPKGQDKLVDTTVFLPPLRNKRAALLELELYNQANVMAFSTGIAVRALQPHQYYFLILASNPDRYGFVKVLSAISPPRADVLGTDSGAFSAGVVGDSLEGAGVD